jgi:hypothetical protein
MKYDIFENDKDKAGARTSLPALVEHPGWKFIIRTLDANIEYLTDKLKSKRDFENLEQVYSLQDRIDDFATLKDLPATIVKEITEDPPEEDQDIYD